MDNAKTIAFDNRGKAWKTRYGFIPTRYAYLDKNFISCRSTMLANELAWLHDVKERPINNFYDVQHKSKLKASFNKDLSSNKLYKSLSLEGTGNLRGGQSRFLANNSSQRSQARDAHVGKLRERGGILYAPLGRNKYISTRNVKIAGVITGIDPLFDDSASLGDTKYGWEKVGIDSSEVALFRRYHLKIDFIPGFNLESNQVKILFGNATPEGGEGGVSPPQQITGPTSLPSSAPGNLVAGYGNNETWETLNSPLISAHLGAGSSGSSYTSYNPPITQEALVGQAPNAPTIEMNNYPEDRNQFVLKSTTQSGMIKTPEGLIVSLNPALIPNAFAQLAVDSINNDAQSGIHLFAYVVTPGFVSGSDPKGQYADIDLDLGKYGYEDFELDVLNLNYEHTRLDHSS